MPLKDQPEKKKKKRLRERLFGLRKRCPQHRPNRLPGFIGLSLVFNKDCCSDNKEKHLLPCKCLACFNSLYVSFLREQFGLIKTQASILYFDTSPARWNLTWNLLKQNNANQNTALNESLEDTWRSKEFKEVLSRMKAGSKDICIAPATKEALGRGLHMVLHAGQDKSPVLRPSLYMQSYKKKKKSLMQAKQGQDPQALTQADLLPSRWAKQPGATRCKMEQRYHGKQRVL